MKSLLLSLCVLTASLAVGCSTAPRTEARRDRLEDRAKVALDRFKQEDPSADKFLSNANAYAVFPTVGKGGAVVGGAYGHGVVYQNGQQVGYCNLTQASVGAQLGGQEFSELVVFQSPEAFNRFKNNQLSFTGNASAIVAKSGAAATAKYDNGVAVFTRSDAGLMAEAALAGQRFTYRTTDSVENDPNLNRDAGSTTVTQTRTTDTNAANSNVRVEERRTNNTSPDVNTGTNPNPNGSSNTGNSNNHIGDVNNADTTNQRHVTTTKSPMD